MPLGGPATYETRRSKRSLTRRPTHASGRSERSWKCSKRSGTTSTTPGAKPRPRVEHLPEISGRGFLRIARRQCSVTAISGNALELHMNDVPLSQAAAHRRGQRIPRVKRPALCRRSEALRTGSFACTDRDPGAPEVASYCRSAGDHRRRARGSPSTAPAGLPVRAQQSVQGAAITSRALSVKLHSTLPGLVRPDDHPAARKRKGRPLCAPPSEAARCTAARLRYLASGERFERPSVIECLARRGTPVMRWPRA